MDTGTLYQGLVRHDPAQGGATDGVYFTYTEEKPRTFEPVLGRLLNIFDGRKGEIKTLLLTLLE